MERKLLEWLFGWEGRGERKLVGSGCFLPGPTKNQSSQIGEIIGEKTRSLLLVAFGQIYPSIHSGRLGFLASSFFGIFLDVAFFFFLLLLIFFFSFSGRCLFFFFFLSLFSSVLLVFVFFFFRKQFWINFLTFCILFFSF